MSELLSKLTGDQALEVLGRLTACNPAMARKIEAEARRILAVVDSDELAAIVTKVQSGSATDADKTHLRELAAAV